MKNSPLKGIHILDLSHRLPGPLASNLLQEMGAQVTKLEDSKFGDPFMDGFFKEMDDSFSLWYQSLNRGKNIERFSFKEEPSQLLSYMDQADLIIMGLPKKLQLSLGLDFDTYAKKRPLTSPVVYLEMIGSHHHTKGMHDINALATARLLDLYLYQASGKEMNHSPQRIAPPFLPIAGISYGAMLANVGVAGLLKATKEKNHYKETVSLEESVQCLLSPFYSKELQKSGQTSFLHNGRYPCYNIYPLADKGHLAVACLEPKYWQKFCELLQLDLKLEQRFHFKSEEVFNVIQTTLSKITSKEALRLFQGEDCCVNVIGATPSL